MNNLKLQIKKAQWIELIGELCYIISAAIYIVDAVIHDGTVMYLIASIFFLVSAIFMIIQSIYLICKIHIERVKEANSKRNSESSDEHKNSGDIV